MLINPAINDPKTLQKYLGCALNFYDNSHFEWNQKYIDMIRKYRVEISMPKTSWPFCDILDYKEAVNMFDGSKVVIEDGGNHSFEGTERYFDKIDLFFDIISLKR